MVNKCGSPRRDRYIEPRFRGKRGVQAAVPIPPVSERDPSVLFAFFYFFVDAALACLPASAAATSGRAALSLPPYLADAWPPQLGSALVLFLRHCYNRVSHRARLRLRENYTAATKDTERAIRGRAGKLSISGRLIAANICN